jgi:hypothetical protein
MLSRVSSFDDLATWEESVSHVPVIVVDPLDDSDDPVEPPSVYVLLLLRPFPVFTCLL